ncbi:pyridoxal phosphate-dependent aminotransferase [Burkholderia sp. BCC1972]|uniref:pyridoxal phosphate-dependent aminotransferase n=1 Tax=Burkholderia sp. BCC1972 TaxID=2817438 RepID=UPI002ABDACC8|nr:pyridoxal phosphate-dependent aminotransferase [Burkholderia sp. BCC1972]
MHEVESNTTFAPVARSAVTELRSSKIREVANAAMGKPEVLPFWFGEPDVPTSAGIRAAAIKSINDAETLYVQTLGLPALREQLAQYVSDLHSTRSVENIAVTSGGVTSLMIAVQSIVGYGDTVVAVTPIWPNLVEMPKVLGASVTNVSLEFSEQGWQLDMNKLIDALRPGTKALLINSPNNPTGWVMSRQERELVLNHCRKHGIWIISDDVYERYYFEGKVAPTFLDFAHQEDRVISCNSFSKTWRMTGWRAGWIVMPHQMLADIGKLIEYNSTCAPAFVQRGAIHALVHGEDEIKSDVERLKRARDRLAAGLAAIPGVLSAPPASGAMYTFFKVEGLQDSLTFAKELVSRGKLGLAPGIAFGPEGEGFLRWCFASSDERLDEGIARLKDYLARYGVAGTASITTAA